MRPHALKKYLSRLFEPTRTFLVLALAVLIYLLPLGSKPEFIEHNGQIVEVPHISPILQSIYPQASYATCGKDGTGTNCHTGCCSAGACVVCPPGPDDQPPSISTNLTCSNGGNNGWCIGSLSLDLAASDPQGAALIISGTIGADNFACPSGATSCSIPLSSEGSYAITYRVDSATGLSASGSTSYKLDLSTPDLSTSLSGVPGTNNWYTSDVTLNVTTSDAVSGISSLTASINGGADSVVNGPLTFSDGIYTVLLTATDNAGNVTQDTQTIRVDTITPSLSFSTHGTSGTNGWYVSTTNVTPAASDSGSGLAALEASVDGGVWSIVNTPLSLSDGVHTHQFRATDNAGNITETPSQTLMVDTIAPFIDMTAEVSLGEQVYFELEDRGSGLSIYRVVIEDDDERYKKVVWLDTLNGNKYKEDIFWDGKFADGTQAGIGEYFITLKIGDVAGNEARKTALVTVSLLSFMQDLPPFTPPATAQMDIPQEDDS